MKKILGLSVSAVLVAGGLVFGSAAAATATVDECVPVEGVDAWTETIPAVTTEVSHPAEYKTVEVSPAVEYQPAVYEIEYEYVHKKANHPNSPRWEKKGWNADDNDNSKGWYSTGNTRNGKLISAEVPAKDAVTKQELVKEAWVETIIVTPEKKIEHPAIEEVVCEEEPEVTPVTKTIKWIMPNGGTPENVTWPQPIFTEEIVPCGETVWLQVDVYPYTTDAEKARTDALDDDGVLTNGEDHGWVKSWSFEKYSAPDCETPEQPAAEVRYGEWTQVQFTCDTEVGTVIDRERAVFTTPYILSNGEWVKGETVITSESGTYTVTEEDIESLECETPTTPEEPEEPTTPTTPVTPVTPEQPKAAEPVSAVVKTVSAPVATDQLAQTGLDLPVFPIALVASVMTAGGAWLLVMAYRRRKVEFDSAE